MTGGRAYSPRTMRETDLERFLVRVALPPVRLGLYVKRREARRTDPAARMVAVDELRRAARIRARLARQGWVELMRLRPTWPEIRWFVQARSRADQPAAPTRNLPRDSVHTVSLFFWRHGATTETRSTRILSAPSRSISSAAMKDTMLNV